MKRFSRRWFTQIMIHRLLKSELDQLKKIVTIETNVNYKLSYGDVIKYLLNYYKKNKRLEFPLENKLFINNSLKNNLSIVYPIDKTTKRISFNLK